jgi:hypothetical protein
VLQHPSTTQSCHIKQLTKNITVAMLCAWHAQILPAAADQLQPTTQQFRIIHTCMQNAQHSPARKISHVQKLQATPVQCAPSFPVRTGNLPTLLQMAPNILSAVQAIKHIVELANGLKQLGQNR